LFAAAVVALALHHAAALAHGSERGFVMLLPTGHYLVGGALVVAATFLLMAALPARAALALASARVPLATLRPAGRTAASLASFAVLAFLLAAGFWGSRDPLANPLPIVIWTLWWTGLTLTQAVTGDLWPWLNPWTGPVRAVAALTGGRLGKRPLASLPDAVGCAPAILAFLGFAWLQLVHPAPDDPEVLARAVLFYWAATFVLCLVFGEEEWRRRGDPFTPFFAAIGLLSPLRRDREEGGPTRLSLVWPGAQLAAAPPLALSHGYLLLAALAMVSFDALAQTFAWMAVGSVNPLEYPGRSALVLQNTLGLAAALLLLPLAYAGGIWLGWSAAARPGTFARALGAYVLSLVPIAVGLHLAHFLGALLVEGQYAAKVASDPFGLGTDLFGTAGLQVTTSFLTTYSGAAWIWNVQTAAVVLGHVLAVIVAHAVALRETGNRLRARLFEVSLAVLMIGYTVLGLWLLSTPVVG
jgi:hypothetical protein